MNKLLIEICIEKSSLPSSNDQSEKITLITIDSFVTLFIYNYLNCPKNIELNFIQNNSLSSNKQQQFLHLRNDYMTIPNEFHDRIENIVQCKLPMYEKDENFFIFGICAICRAIVLRTNEIEHEKFIYLLGFKGNCLLAPSERSIWTKLCEVDMLNAMKDILKSISDANGDDRSKNFDILLSNCFTIFENHMGKPTRVHNFYKLLREKIQNKQKQSKNLIEHYEESEKENSTTLEHKFAEGYHITLVDIILYPFIKFLHLIMNNDETFKDFFPLIHNWIKNLENCDKNLEENFLKILDVDYYVQQLKRIRKLNFIKNNEIEINSLYRNDIKLQKNDKEYTNQININLCLEKIQNLNLNIKSRSTLPQQLKLFDWNQIQTDYVQPEHGNLPVERLQRKKDQLRNLLNATLEIAKPNDIIVDFCSGTGHLGIILAEILPQCHIIFLENKFISIMKTKERIEKLKLRNCSFYQSNIDYFDRKFNIGISLHACGTATDLVLLKCIKSNANFICCPCCYGSIKSMPHITYPLSKTFNEILNSNENDYLCIAHAADQSHDINVKNCNLIKREQGEYCMDVIDTDRKFLAEENNYSVKLRKLYPEDCTPKNRLLIGIKKRNIEERC